MDKNQDKIDRKMIETQKNLAQRLAKAKIKSISRRNRKKREEMRADLLRQNLLKRKGQLQSRRAAQQQASNSSQENQSG